MCKGKIPSSIHTGDAHTEWSSDQLTMVSELKVHVEESEVSVFMILRDLHRRFQDFTSRLRYLRLRGVYDRQSIMDEELFSSGFKTLLNID